MTDKLSNIIEVTDYLPFGDQRINANTSAFDENRKFTGHVYDNDTELNFMNARYQSGKTGQFLSQDPIFWSQKIPIEILSDPQQLNSYSYARNNPVNRVDPTGQFSKATLKKFTSNLSKVFSLFSNYLRSINIFSEPRDVSVPINDNKVNLNHQRTTTWDVVSNQKISDLDSRVQQPTTNFINNTESQLGVRLRVYSGYRSIEEQNALFEQSQKNLAPGGNGRWITDARGGQSYHNYGLAIDVVRISVSGEADWTRISPDIADIAKQEGFLWGGDWNGYKDYPHFEMTFGQHWSDLINN